MFTGSAVVAGMAPVHEHVNERTEKQERVRQHSKKMDTVLLPEEERRDREKQAERHPGYAPA